VLNGVSRKNIGQNVFCVYDNKRIKEAIERRFDSKSSVQSCCREVNNKFFKKLFLWLKY